MTAVGLFILTILVAYLLFEFQKEKRRNRVLQAFIAGTIRSISEYIGTDHHDLLSSDDLVKIYDKKLPIPYSDVLHNISKEFEKDFWSDPYRKWLKKDRNLFYKNKYANDGFNMIYWDFFDRAVAQMGEECFR